MNYVLNAHGEGIHVSFRDRLDALQDDARAWSSFMSELLPALAEAPRRAVYVDLRFVDFVDSRSLFQLQAALATTNPPVEIHYLGPGPGYSRLCALGEAPALAPLSAFPPWDDAIAKRSPLDSLASSAGESELAPESRPASIVESKTTPADAPETSGASLLQGGAHEPASRVLPPVAMETRPEAPATPACAAPESSSRLTRALTLEDVLAMPADGAEPSLETKNNGPPTPAVAEPTQFSIDIDYEQWLIDHASDARDSAISIAPLEFNDHWFSPAAERVDSLAESSKTESLVAAGVEERARAASQPSEAPVTTSSAAEAMSAPSSSAAGSITARLKAVARACTPAAQPRASARCETADGSSLTTQREPRPLPKATIESSDLRAAAITGESPDSLLHGVGSLLREVGRLERNRASLVAEQERQAEVHRNLRAEIETLREEARDSGSARKSPEVERRSILFGRAQESFAKIQSLATRWRGLVDSFRQRGILSPSEFERLVGELGAIGCGWAGFDAFASEAAGERARGEFCAEWRGLALALATRVREESNFESCAALARTLTLATLYSPLRVGTPAGHQVVCRQLCELFQGGAFLRPDEAPDTACERCADDLSLWRAARLVTDALRGRMSDWNRALQSVVARLDSMDAVRTGIARIADAHSHYYFGTWVELSTGEVGPVVETMTGRPDCPRVLVLFRRHGELLAPAPPRQFPADRLEVATIVRVVAEPYLSDAGANTRRSAPKAAADAAVPDAAAPCALA